jgi:hypothetical protein
MQPSDLTAPHNPAQLERTHVHQVYDHIAAHFSETRYKAWPLVRRFVEEQPVGSVLADVGCGNGKNLVLNQSIFALGCDRFGLSRYLCLLIRIPKCKEIRRDLCGEGLSCSCR